MNISSLIEKGNKALIKAACPDPYIFRGQEIRGICASVGTENDYSRHGYTEIPDTFICFQVSKNEIQGDMPAKGEYLYYKKMRYYIYNVESYEDPTPVYRLYCDGGTRNINSNG